MKSTFSILLLTLPLLFMASHCPKKNKAPRTLRGRIVAGCDGTPMANLNMMFSQQTTQFNTGGRVGECTTDENGYFELIYTPEHNGLLTLYSHGPVLTDIPLDDQLDLGDVYYSAAVNFTVRLDVQNPYTDQDTLYYYDWNYPVSSTTWVKKIPGPFQSGFIDTVTNATFMDFPISYSKESTIKVNYYINVYDPNNNAKVSLMPCSGNYAEAVLTVH